MSEVLEVLVNGSHTRSVTDRSDTGAGNFDIEFNYNQILWETGDASGSVVKAQRWDFKLKRRTLRNEAKRDANSAENTGPQGN